MLTDWADKRTMQVHEDELREQEFNEEMREGRESIANKAPWINLNR